MVSSNSLWTWKRYWLPNSSFSETLVSGLLPSKPDGDYRTLEELSDQRLLVLLGEPGSGKSVEMSRERDRVRNQTGPNRSVIYLDGRSTVQTEGTLHRLWFDSEAWGDWQEASEHIWIFFDGFDESVQHIKGLSGIIQEELTGVIASDADRASRISIRIASRTSGWQHHLGDTLFCLLHPNKVEAAAGNDYAFHLAPPRWDDIEVAAAAKGLDGKSFLNRIREHGIEALALRPAQLVWLLNIFAADGHFPDHKGQLYWEGMRQLCQDPMQEVDADYLRAVAGRVAFVTMFGGLRSLWLAPDRGDVSPGSIPLSELIGGTERTSRESVDVTNDVLRGLVRSGLFTSFESTQAVWAHQTYPEYLAAKHLSQMTGLITNPHDPSQKILPSMVEVAAWMAAMHPELLDHLVDHDPGALVASDVALTGPKDRERLLRAFLASLENGDLVTTRWSQQGHYTALYFQDIGDVLIPFIVDKTLRKTTRDTAIDIAVDCRLHELADELAAIALDKSELEVLRRSAAWAVTRLENQPARRELLPLVSAAADEDPFEELKGCAMRANWPVNLSLDDILEHLARPRWEGLGAYRLFLSQHFVKHLGDENLLSALKWLDQQAHWEERQYDLDQLETQFVVRSLGKLEDAAVFDWVVHRVASNVTQYKPWLGKETDSDTITELLSSSSHRRRIIQELPQVINDSGELGTAAYMVAEHLRHYPAWLSEDFAWMAQRLKETEAGSKAETFWLHLLQQSFSPTDLKQISLLYHLYMDSRFASQSADWFEPIDRRSPAAAQWKKTWQVIAGQLDEDQDSTGARIDTEAQIMEILDRIEDGRSGDWWHIDDWLMVDERNMKLVGSSIPDVTELPGWSLCSEVTQRRIIRTAPAFLRSHHPDNSHVGTATYFLADHAAYRALGVLLRDRPHELDLLPADTWQELGPIILSMHPRASGEDISHQEALLRRAIERGFDPVPWLITMASRAGEDSTFYFAPGLKVVTSLSTSIELERLVASLIRPALPTTALVESVRILCERGVQSAFVRALETGKELAAEPEGSTHAAKLLAALMDFIHPDLWTGIWTILENDDDLFDQVLLQYTRRHRDAFEFASKLNEHAVAQLYQRLVKRFAPSQDPNVAGAHFVSHRESLGRWREELLTSLAMRGTWEAVHELRCLTENLDIDWLPIRVAEAEGEARRRTWQPPSIQDLLLLTTDENSRLITSPRQLHDVIVESLGRLQQSLLGESPAAIDLWNVKSDSQTGTPKDELLISDYVKRHLDRDLKHFGIIVNREVENRPRNEIDLYVQHLDPNSSLPITVVCEVKGCWHRDLYTSMSSQLHERYMKQQGLSHGIYLVPFFDGDRWDSSDHASRHKARQHSFDELQTHMTSQASMLTDEMFCVGSFVLDCRY